MKPPKLLVNYLVVWFVFWLFNTATVFVDLNATIAAFMEQIQTAKIDFTEEQAKNIFITVTALISMFQLSFAFALYKGVKAVRIMDLFFKILGLPFSLFGLISFASLGLLEQFQSVISLALTCFGIFVLFNKEVKDYFYFDASVASAEVNEADIDSLEEKI